MIVGIDIGGTFTDLICCEGGNLCAVKVASTPDDFSAGFENALDGIQQEGVAVEDIVHATTVATNALIQRKGATVGMITTRGFRDILSLRRRDRRGTYGQETAFRPLIPRALRREVAERSSPGDVLVPVNIEEVLQVADQLWTDGVDAILVAFLHAVTCPQNELDAVKALNERWPGKLVFASHQTSEVATEFERFSTGAASAYVAPLVNGYLDGITGRLDQPDQLSVVVSDGGLVAPDAAKANPVRTVLSGPAAGVWGAKAVCEQIGLNAFVACDMGGTSFDACLVSNGSPALTKARELSFGIPLAVEMLDIATIGAGGGSIVTVSPAGTVEVGPEGVGAEPGPACYGVQVHRATVTDADLVLGRVSSTLRLPSGARELDADAAWKTINERVAQPLGVSVEESASLILSTVEEKMADRIRRMALRARVDLTDHLLFAYGGAGPLHAAGIVAPLGINHIVVPPNAGMFSAWGGLLTQRRETISTVRPFELGTGNDLSEIVKDHKTRLAHRNGAEITHLVSCGLAGSLRSIDIPISIEDNALKVRQRFASVTGVSDGPITVTQVSSTRLEPNPRALETLQSVVCGSSSGKGYQRTVYFGDNRVEACQVLARGSLAEGASGDGPCVIEEAGATTVVPPDFTWRVGPSSMLFIEQERQL